MAGQQWGVYDTVDKCWIGDWKGPLLYNDPMMARLQALWVDLTRDWHHRRCVSKAFDCAEPSPVSSAVEKTAMAKKRQRKDAYDQYRRCDSTE